MKFFNEDINMILYFTGTGDSRFSAEIIGKDIGDDVVSINYILKNKVKDVIVSEKPFIFVIPIYAWRIPRVVESFIKDSIFEGSDKAYFVLTCAAKAGNAIHYVRKICKEKCLNLEGVFSVIMPENYIAMFDTPSKEESEIIIDKAVPHIFEISKYIKNGESNPNKKIMACDRFLSYFINPIFYLSINDRGFYSTDTCSGCGKCLILCPLNNIDIELGRPIWKKNCTHCMACISGCPSESIQYKNKTKNKLRYFNDRYKDL